MLIALKVVMHYQRMLAIHMNIGTGFRVTAADPGANLAGLLLAASCALNPLG
jgi:hypothetical protein